MTSPTKTLCPYCGVGCGLEVLPVARAGRSDSPSTAQTPSYQVRGDRSHSSSQGMVCVKGATVAESLDRDRLLYPMLRDSLDQPFQRVSWEHALTEIVRQIQSVRQKFGSDALCMYGSGQFQTEDYYIAQKLFKGCLGTNNFDANSRLCMSSAVSGYIQSLGADGPPCCYEDLDHTDCAFLIGTNTAECHPIVFNRLRRHQRKNAEVKLIVVDPRRTLTAEAADVHLAIRPGTDINLLHGIAHLLLDWGAIDAQFIANHTRGFSDYKAVISHYPPAQVAAECGIELAQLEQAARYWAQSKRVLSLWSMGVNQSSEGTAKVSAVINLHLLTGQIGKPGAGPFSLTGQPNAMGGREAGGLASLLPGYRSVKDSQHRADLEQAWGLPPGQIAPAPGRTVWEMITGIEAGAVHFFWIAATNPAVSLPDLARTKAALRQSPFTVYQDAYYPTETAEFAHLLLPAAQWGEKTGCMTNSERVVSLCQQFRSPPGEARADWEIFAEVGRRLGFEAQFGFSDSAAVFAEFQQLTRDRPCDQTGISHDRLRQEGPLQWPCPVGDISTGNTKRLYTDWHFRTPDGRAQFVACHARGLAEPPDPDYPYVFTNGRLYGHWHTQTRTGRIEKIRKMHPQPFLEIHPRDAAQLQLQNQDWVKVRSPRSWACFQVTVTSAMPPGTVFAPMHWGSLWADNAEVNALTHAHACPQSQQPELKACAVQLEPLTQLEKTTQNQSVPLERQDQTIGGII
jgi:ferredoxin-nitrate reductase